MKVVLDIECNALHNPDKIWVIVCKDIDSGLVSIFRNLTDDAEERLRFCNYICNIILVVGHNILGYDLPILKKLIDLDIDVNKVIDTLIISKLVNYSRVGGHSIAQYGEEFGLEKIKFSKWSEWSQEMEDYCVRDVEICHRVYNSYSHILADKSWGKPIKLEQNFQLICTDLSDNGFAFNTSRANILLDTVTKKLDELDDRILEAFPPKEVLIREFTPKLTKFGTISRTSVPRQLHPEIHKYESGQTYKHTRLVPFNPSSHKQVIEVLNEAKWKPEDKTTTHLEVERELSILKYTKVNSKRDSSYSKEGTYLETNVLKLLLTTKLEKLKVYGWKINENNLSTLPKDAPEGARLLAERIQYESRRRTLTEWVNLCGEDGRIHGDFQGIGAWTHRMAHQKPNTANIPNPTNLDGTTKLLGKELRQLWIAPKNRLLVGVDAEGIQLRIFAHYIQDEEFTDALVRGRKDNKTDPHSLNQRILGNVCKTRAGAKRFVFALLLGGGIAKLASILGCSTSQAKEALDRLLERYTGFARLRKTDIPRDAKNGYFIGLDGRRVPIPGATQRDREHLCMSGYLQNGEAIVIKTAAILANEALSEDNRRGWWKFVNIVHDEYQNEIRNSVDYGIKVAKIICGCIEQAGRDLDIRCPLAGSYYNDDSKKNTIGLNWYATH